MLLLLPTDMIRAVCDSVSQFDVLATALSCKTLRACWTTLQTALHVGNLHSLQWAHANGYHLSVKTFFIALRKGNFVTLDWIRSQIVLSKQDLWEATVYACCMNYRIDCDHKRVMDYLESVCGLSFELPTANA